MLIMLLSGLLLTAPAILAQDARFEPWVGSYESAAPDEAKTIIDRAIEEGTKDMGAVKRKIARKRLKSINPPYRVVRIIMNGEQLITDFDGRRYSAPTHGGEAKGVDPDGEDVTVSYKRDGRLLRARYVGDDGEKRIDFEIDPNGDELIMHVTVLSSKLDEPIRYSLPYQRVD